MLAYLVQRSNGENVVAALDFSNAHAALSSRTEKLRPLAVIPGALSLLLARATFSFRFRP
jgi:hypothetical protein